MTGRFNVEPLRSSGFRRFFASSLIASLSLWIFSPAFEWVMLTQTGRASAVGLIQSTLIVAVALATLPSGLLVDRLGARRTIMISLSGMAVVVAIVALITNAGLLTFEIAIGMTFLLGLFDGLWSVPAALLVAQIVEPRQLGSAIGLSYLTGGLGRLVGAPLGGTVLQLAGATQAFLPAAVALGVAALVTAAIPLPAREEHHERTPGIRGLGLAAQWMLHNPTARTVTLLACLSGAALFTYSALLPAFTRDLLRSESATLGLLTGAGGLGAIIGALVMDASGRRIGRGRQIVVMLLGAALCVGLLGLTSVLPVAVLLVGSLVLLSVLFGGTAQLIVQSSPPPRLRASVMAVYTFAFYIALPIGTTAVGFLADRFGVGTVLVGMALFAIAGVVLVVLSYRSLLGVDIDSGGEVRIPGEPRDADAGAIVAP